MPFGYSTGYPVMSGQMMPIMYSPPPDPSSPQQWGVPLIGSPWSPQVLPPWVADAGSDSSRTGVVQLEDASVTQQVHDPGPPIQMVPDGHGKNCFVLNIISKF